MRQNPHVRICGGPGSATTLVYPTPCRRRGSPLRSSEPEEGVGLAYTLANIWQTLGITFRYMARHNEVLQPSPSSDTCQAVPNPGLRSPRVLSLQKVKQSGAPVARSPHL